MNDRFDLRIITQPHSQVYWGYFRRLVFGNSSTKHNKLTYFSNLMLFCSDVLLPFSHIPRCIHAKTPDFPRLFEPRVFARRESIVVRLPLVWKPYTRYQKSDDIHNVDSRLLFARYKTLSELLHALARVIPVLTILLYLHK